MPSTLHQALAVALLLATPTLAVQSAVFTAEDMLDIVSLSGGQPVALSSDGAWVSYVLPDRSDERNVGEFRPTGFVYVHPLEGGGEPRPLSEGEDHSSFPVWSPDGQKLALYLEDERGGRIAIWERGSGRVTPYGEIFSGRSYVAPQWDPSSASLVYAASIEEPDPPPPPRVRVVESTDERIPGDEFFLDRRTASLVVLDVASGKTRDLLDEPVRLRSLRLSPTGEDLLFTAPSPETYGIIGREEQETFLLSVSSGSTRRVGSGDRFSFSPDGGSLLAVDGGDLVKVPLEGGERTPYLSDLDHAVGEPIWAPDGKRFVTLVPDPSVQDPEIEPPQSGMYSIARPFMDLYLVSADEGSSRNLTASFEDQVSDPLWSPDGREIYFRAVDNDTYDETLYRYVPADDRLTAVREGEESYDRLAAGGGRLVAAVQSATHPEDLWAFEAASGEATRVTELNPQLARFRFSEPELFHFHNADGERLGALLYKPVGFAEGDEVPVITYVYEKLTPGIHRFSPRHQILLNHGYAVLMPNVKVRVGQTATSFVKSVVPAVNAVRAMGFTNGKFALWGGSFGAYATSYVITQTDIFACAVSRATPPELFRNWASGRDRDSRNIERGQARMGGSPFEYMERYLTQSAFFQLDKVNTPVLILHGVEDYTILFAEGEMMFYALRQLGKEATFVVYTHGDHSLSRHSREDTIDVHRRMLDWFEKHMKKS